MADTTRAGQVVKEMKGYWIKVVGISETRWKGTVSVTLQSGEKVVYVGNDEAQQGGVAIMKKRQKQGVEQKQRVLSTETKERLQREKQAIGVEDKQGVLRTGTTERLQRWVEHFSEILNRDGPTNPVEEDGIVQSEDIKEIDLGRWRSQEVKDALKRTNPGKAGRSR
ncbi:unnamed protein product [Porites lobata]|uniref:Uncharacterized protein n=1 Tax=Porites lobata TaxID=104759 RepID=A0ABN8NXM5_9CNID|nr:unnamed protein product [Porites lobata]